MPVDTFIDLYASQEMIKKPICLLCRGYSKILHLSMSATSPVMKIVARNFITYLLEHHGPQPLVGSQVVVDKL